MTSSFDGAGSGGRGGGEGGRRRSLEVERERAGMQEAASATVSYGVVARGGGVAFDRLNRRFSMTKSESSVPSYRAAVVISLAFRSESGRAPSIAFVDCRLFFCVPSLAPIWGGVHEASVADTMTDPSVDRVALGHSCFYSCTAPIAHKEQLAVTSRVFLVLSLFSYFALTLFITTPLVYRWHR